MKLCSSLMWRDCGLNLWKSKGSFVHGRLTVRAVSAESLQAAPAWTQLWLLLTVKYSNLCPGSHTSTANISADPAIILGNLLLEIWSIRYHSKYAEVEHLTSLWFLVTSAAETCWMLQGRAAPGRIYETIPQRLQHDVWTMVVVQEVFVWDEDRDSLEHSSHFWSCEWRLACALFRAPTVHL